ncbi:FAS1-like dehydratase domain-containing protein [Pseudomonas sp. HK3]
MMHETLLVSPPSLLSLYARALFKRHSAQPQQPNIATLVLNTAIHQKQLLQYKALCGDTSASEIVSPLYPQVLAFKLHLELLLNKQLPFPVMGLVHRDNEVEYFSPIYPSDQLTIKVGLSDYKKNNKGINCTLLTQVYVSGILKWQATSTYVYRQIKNAPMQRLRSKNLKIIEQPNNLSIWSLPANLGRQYAKITGDLNPIHLYSLTAKLFGFKKDHYPWHVYGCESNSSSAT